MCEALGEFMRLTLALAARESVPLADEMALVERYLSIERVRFGARLASDVQVAPGAETALVPPLLLQPLVENAVKHGVASRLEGGCIRIDARREAEHLVVRIENPCDAEPVARRGASVGLENVRQRLRATDSGRSQLVAGRDGEMFRVVLTLADRSIGEAR
jgi:LytS/YehU family sensor histidine kinase